MMGDFWLIRDKQDIDKRMKTFTDFLKIDWDWDKPVSWKVEVYSPKRSLSQNSLFHLWVREICVFLLERKKVPQPEKLADLEEEIKELLCFKFLGTVDKQVGQTVIPAQVQSTKKLTQGEFYFFMNQVQDWALDLGIHLSHPQDSEFMKLQRAQ